MWGLKSLSRCGGKKLRSIIFTGVLYVPALAEDLFSVLTLTRKHRFRIMIDFDTMSFIRDKAVLFTAAVGADNVALLNGTTRVQPSATSSPLPPLGCPPPLPRMHFLLSDL